MSVHTSAQENAGPPALFRPGRSNGGLPSEVSRSQRVKPLFPGVLLAALTVGLSFEGGGFFVGATGTAAVASAAIGVIALTVLRRPFDGFGGAAPITAALLTVLTGLTLLSANWSDSAARALVSYDRVLLYLLVFVVFVLLGGAGGGLRGLVRGLAGALLLVSGGALASRLLPALVPSTLGVYPGRLAFPLTYYNATGFAAALCCLVAYGLTCDRSEAPLVRAASAAAVPVAAVTLYFTFSRGSIVVLGVSLMVYWLAARPGRVIAGTLATAPWTAIALLAAVHAPALASSRLASDLARSQGLRVALIVAGSALAAGAARALLPLLERRVSVRPLVTRRLRIGVISVGAVAALVLGIAFRERERQVVHDFVHVNSVTDRSDLRKRFLEVGNNGRLDLWRVAADGFGARPVLGQGAGTYQLRWERDRRLTGHVVHAHSVYLETLDELGLVGTVALVGALGLILFGVARALRKKEAGPSGVVLAAVVAWLIHSGVDWDWEVPAITVWLFAVGGVVLARSGKDGDGAQSHHWPARLLVGLALLAAAVPAAGMALSQRNLNAAVDAFRAGDCRTARGKALDSIQDVPARPEPFDLIAYCAARRGRDQVARTAALAAIRRDPRSWDVWYSLALLDAAVGRDPHGSLERARRLDPKEPLIRTAVRQLGASPPELRKERARALRLPLP